MDNFPKLVKKAEIRGQKTIVGINAIIGESPNPQNAGYDAYKQTVLGSQKLLQQILASVLLESVSAATRSPDSEEL